MARSDPVAALLFAVALSVFSAAGADSRFQHAWPNTDLSLATVDLDEVISGGPGRDGIPAIDEPRFETVASARGWIADEEPVILLRLEGRARAYPLQIMTWHEIVNDRFGDIPVAVTFCPLCNAAIVFDRRLGERELDFGTSGLLRLSDLVMYDRQTESWWQQFGGEAIAGDLAGSRLQAYPASIISFADFARRFPDGSVLSRDTGHRRAYGNNPYPGYDRVDQRPFLLSVEPDPRLAPMDRVLGLRINGETRLYPHSRLRDAPIVHDTLAGVEVLVLALGSVGSALDASRIANSRAQLSADAFDRRIGGRVLDFRLAGDALKDLATGSIWNRHGEAISGPLSGARLRHLGGGAHFAFAWLAFEPRATIWGHETPTD